MRLSIRLSEDEIAELNELAKRESVSRASLVRQAIINLLDANRLKRGDAIAAAFGLWGKRGEDGLAYQERLRAEWGD